jgi:hypothetical protein
MFIFLIGLLIGGSSVGVVGYQTMYCDCFRADFAGAKCESVKGSGIQGSCHK